MGIYYVQLSGPGGTKAELEISDGRVACVSGSTTHFEFTREQLVLAEQTRPNTILLNFLFPPAAGEKTMGQVVLTSANCLSIMDELLPS